MIKSVIEAAERFRLFEGVSHITVALSGGADSMSLLYALYELRRTYGFTLDAAHLNHMFRGEEADRDEAFVRRECEKLGIELFCERIDVPKYAASNKLSDELAAREVRYAFLERVASGAVATAHTASDNFETVLFNLTRGASLKGLCGIPAKRGIFIRPLLFCTRADVERYCTENGIDYVTDSTNLSDDYTRNKIRHNVVPVLLNINPAAETAVARTVTGLNDDEGFISDCAEKILSENINACGRLNVKEFDSVPRSVASRVIKEYFKIQLKNAVLDNSHINDIYSICLSGGRTSLPLGFSAVCKNSELFAEKAEKRAVPKRYSVEITEKVNDLFTKNEKINNLLLINSLDCDKIEGKSILRTRMSGDSIRLRGRTCTKTLKKLFTEYKIPQEERGSIPVLADRLGVIWIYGFGAAQRCAVTENSERILIINASDVQNKTD